MNPIDQLRGVDIYLIDQILKDRFRPGDSLLDAGCGGGRNVTWFLANDYNVHACDSTPTAISEIRHHAHHLSPNLPAENFRIEPVEQMTFSDASFDVVLSIAVLHFARDEAQFTAMLHEMWRVLKPGGFLFARLASDIGIEHFVQPLSTPGRFAIPDGSTRYLVNLETLLQLTAKLYGQLLEPIKTVNVQNMRCMTTWVLQKL